MEILKYIIIFMLFVIGLFSNLAYAHDYPIYPVKIDIKVESQKICACIRTNAVYWREKVLGGKCIQSSNWPEDVKQKAKNYLDYHFSVFLDNELLKGSLIDSRYIEAPFIGADKAELFFKIEYPVTAAGRNLTVSSKFFYEYHEHIESKHSHQGYKHGSVRKEFVTHLNISGKIRQKIIIPVCNPERSFSFKEVLITPEQRSIEFLGLGFSYIAKERFAIMIIILIFILHRLGRISVIQLPVLFSLLFAGLLFGMVYPLFFPYKLLLLGKLFVLLILSAMIYLQSADALKLPVLFLAMPVWGFTAAKETYYSDEAIGAFVSVNMVFFAGWIFTIMLLFFVVYILFNLDEKYIIWKSKSMADKLFKQHLQFAALLILITSAYFLFKIIKGGPV
ncbi:MAG: hypothetical protein A3J83_07045 [Elusimicrobia bacterium RIFOXYA2_FULL_40_6]|nr:MAG: hypothetical protein A3J83_07045 [Elusimicrobia bacterium RIFOXYA2_FULL_40_6]